MRSCAALLGLLGVALGSSPVLAAEPAEPAETRQMTRQEIEAWLDSSAVDNPRDVGVDEPVPEAPPPPPRHHGFVVEGAVGGVGHLSTMKTVSPVAPEFRLLLGYDVFDPLLLFADASVILSSTRYAKPPPSPRTYAYYAFGGGLRFTLEFGESFGLYLQGNVGAAAASEDVLVVYGYRDSDELSLYYGGQLGFEWFQVNPHYALAAHAGLKNYLGLARERSNDPPLAINAGLAIKYTF